MLFFFVWSTSGFKRLQSIAAHSVVTHNFCSFCSLLLIFACTAHKLSHHFSCTLQVIVWGIIVAFVPIAALCCHAQHSLVPCSHNCTSPLHFAGHCVGHHRCFRAHRCPAEPRVCGESRGCSLIEHACMPLHPLSNLWLCLHRPPSGHAHPRHPESQLKADKIATQMHTPMFTQQVIGKSIEMAKNRREEVSSFSCFFLGV